MKYWNVLFLLGWVVTNTASTHTIDAYPQKISFEFQNIEVSQALQILAKYAPFNLVVEHTVQGKIDLYLKKVTVEEAIATILQIRNLVKQSIGQTWVIKANDNPAEKKQDFLTTKCFELKHRSAKEIIKLFLDNHGQKKIQESTLSVDEYSNRFWMQDIPKRVQLMQNLVHAFDHPIEQVLIEARIISVNRRFGKQLGNHLKLQPFQEKKNEGQANQNDEESSQISEANQQDKNLFSPMLNIDLPISNHAITVNIPLIGKGLNQILDLELSAMESEGHGHVIAKPHLMTMNRNTAVVASGSELPYQEKSKYGNTSVFFKKAVLSLKVTPEITSENQLFLNLQINHDKPSTVNTQEAPAINTQTLSTKVRVQSGQTVVLGGIYENFQENNIKRTPFLGKLPILKLFFSQYHREDTTQELMIFVTPYIIRDNIKQSS